MFVFMPTIDNTTYLSAVMASAAGGVEAFLGGGRAVVCGAGFYHTYCR